MELNEENSAFLSKLVSCPKVAHAQDFDLEDCWRFWHSENVAQWLRHKGYLAYTPYYRMGPGYVIPSLECAKYCEANYPYAYHQTSYYVTTLDLTGKFVYAQDLQGRHVAIKVTRVDSDEYRILRFLHEQGQDVMQQQCILPILEMFNHHDACFAVMPRWGNNVTSPPNHTLGGLLRIMQSMLKAVHFLHSNNIIHRDLNMYNVLTNFFGDDLVFGGYYSVRRAHVEKDLLSYALIDFDISTMVPANIKKEDYRRPWYESYGGTLIPCDTLQAEFDYDPFVYDIGTLGVAFCQSFQCYTTQIPMLAPFLDRMVARDLKKRFTASQALDFLTSIIENAPKEQLAIPQNPDAPRTHFEKYDRWAGLPADFQKQWAEYREPFGIPFSWKLIRAIRRIEWLPPSLMPNLGWFISKIKSFFFRS